MTFAEFIYNFPTYDPIINMVMFLCTLFFTLKLLYILIIIIFELPLL